MKLDEAIVECFEAHKGQYDKAGQEYFTHPLRVMRKILFEDFQAPWAYGEENEQDVLVVAVLHDVLEDTEHILQHLNKAQSEALGAITRHFAEFEGETYKEYIARCCQNPIARVVKYYDLQDNMSPERMSYLEKGEQKGMRERYEWSLKYIEGL